MAQTLDKEWGTYERHREQLLALTSGKFVLIFGEDIIGISPSEEDAITQGFHHLGSVDFFVKHITRVEKPVSFFSNPPKEGQSAWYGLQGRVLSYKKSGQ